MYVFCCLVLAGDPSRCQRHLAKTSMQEFQLTVEALSSNEGHVLDDGVYRFGALDGVGEFFEELFASIDYSLLVIFLGTFVVIANICWENDHLIFGPSRRHSVSQHFSHSLLRHVNRQCHTQKRHVKGSVQPRRGTLKGPSKHP